MFSTYTHPTGFVRRAASACRRSSKLGLCSAAAFLAICGGAQSGALHSNSLIVHGQVVTSDGSAPPKSMQIERVCGATRFNEGVTDGHGRFALQVSTPRQAMDGGGGAGQTEPPWSRARTGGASSFDAGSDTMVGCLLRASAPGFRSTAVEIEPLTLSGMTADVVLVVESVEKVTGLMTSATDHLATKAARKNYERALKAERRGEWAEARAKLEAATAETPRFASAWAELGRVLDHEGERARSAGAFQQALAADGKLVAPYIALASMAAAEGGWAETERYSSQALTLDPIDFPGAYLLNGLANFKLGRLDAAENSARRGIRLDRRGRIAHLRLLLGRILLSRREYAGAIENYRSFIDSSPEAPEVATAQQELRDAESQRAQPLVGQ